MNVRLKAGLAAVVLAALITGVVPVAGGTATVAQAATVKDMTVRTMTYNVQYAGASSKAPKAYQPWSARGPQVARWVRWNSPDVIGFQENNSTTVNGKSVKQLTTIDDEYLSDYTWVGVDQWTVPIAFRKAKFTLVSSGITRISKKGESGGKFNRYLSWAVLTDRATKRKFIAFNTHLEPYTNSTAAKVRTLEVKRIIAKVRALNPGLDTPFVIGGDFNFNEKQTGVYAQARSVMTAAKLVDGSTITMARNDEVPNCSSWHDYGITVSGTFRYKVIKQNNWHYDYSWVPTGARVNTWKISSGPNVTPVKLGSKTYYEFGPGALPSDHSPVVTSITYPGHLTDPAGTSANPARSAYRSSLTSPEVASLKAALA